MRCFEQFNLIFGADALIQKHCPIFFGENNLFAVSEHQILKKRAVVNIFRSLVNIFPPVGCIFRSVVSIFRLRDIISRYAMQIFVANGDQQYSVARIATTATIIQSLAESEQHRAFDCCSLSASDFFLD